MAKAQRTRKPAAGPAAEKKPRKPRTPRKPAADDQQDQEPKQAWESGKGVQCAIDTSGQ